MKTRSKKCLRDIRNLINFQENKSISSKLENTYQKNKTLLAKLKLSYELISSVKNLKIRNSMEETNTTFEEFKEKNFRSDKNLEKKAQFIKCSSKSTEKNSIKILKNQKNQNNVYIPVYKSSQYTKKNKTQLDAKIITYIIILISFSFFIFCRFNNRQLNKLKTYTKIKNRDTTNSIQTTKNQKNDRKLQKVYNGGYITIICSDSQAKETLFYGNFLTNAKTEISLEVNDVAVETTNPPYYLSNWSGKTLKILFTNPIDGTMQNMFYSKKYLKEIDMTKVKIGNNCKSMYGMFQLCDKLTFANLSRLNVSSVTTMELIFYDCDELISVDMSYIISPKLNTLTYSFKNCKSLKSANLKNMSTRSLTNCYQMFYSDSKLTHIDLRGLNTQTVTTMGYMFYHCSSLTSLDLCSFSTEKSPSTSYMFINVNDELIVHLDQNKASKISDRLSSNKIEMKSCENIIVEDFSFKGCDANKVELEMKITYSTGYKDGTLIPQLKDENNNIYDINCMRKSITNGNTITEKCELNYLTMDKINFSIYLENIIFYSDIDLKMKETDVLCYLSDELEFTNNKILIDDSLGCGKIEVNSISDIDSCTKGKHSITVNLNYPKYLYKGKYKIIFRDNIVFECAELTSEKKK